MKRAIFLTVCLFVFWRADSVFGAEISRPRVYVLSVLQVHSSDEFTCRVDEWKRIKNIPLRVKVRGLGKEGSRQEGRDILENLLLGSGKELVLRNIEDRGYFRISADVFAGPVNLAELITSLAAVSQTQTQENPQEQVEQKGSDFTKSTPEVPVSLTGNNKTVQLRPRRQEIQIENLLKKEADLSALREDVSIREALEIIRTSVEPPLPLIVLWPDLSRNLLIEPDRPIGLEIRGKISLGLALELILSSASPSGRRAVLLAEDNVFLIVSPQFAALRMRPKVYDIQELTSFGILGEMNSANTGNSGGYRK